MVALTCECCGYKETFASAEEAFRAGWDEPSHTPSWPISCPLCPGVCAMGRVDHSVAHARWLVDGRPAEFSMEDLPPVDPGEAQKVLNLLAEIGVLSDDIFETMRRVAPDVERPT